jgi:hypothetical protein
MGTTPHLARTLVESLAARGIALGLADGEIMVSPAGAIRPADLIRLSINRESVIEFLRARDPFAVRTSILLCYISKWFVI